MIISDSHKFIFFHVPKSAGTSLACKLAPYSNNRELLFPDYELYIDDIISERYNNQESVQKIVKKIPKQYLSPWFQEHPEELTWLNLPHYMFDPHNMLYRGPVAEYLNNNKNKLKDYCKFVIVRNSWDYVFSIFKNKIAVRNANQLYDGSTEWYKVVEEQINKEAFLHFMDGILSEYENLSDPSQHSDIFRSYFYNPRLKIYANQQIFFCNIDMQSYANRILFFHRLHEGLQEISNEIGIDLTNPPECNVSGKKMHKDHYVDFYDEKSRDFVEHIFKLDIERFNFKFGE